MEYTREELEANVRTLRSQLARPEENVRFKDRGVTYFGADDMRRRLDYFERELQRFTGRPRQTTLVGSKGL